MERTQSTAVPLVCLVLLFLAKAHVSFALTGAGNKDEYRKECIGSDLGSPSHDNNPSRRYENYRIMYTNCTHVLKNLEIIYLDGNDTYDLSFLSEIREVNGYIYIIGNHIDYLPLNNLRVIRGRKLYHGKVPSTGASADFSLYITQNVKINSTVFGLKEIHLTSLHEIMAGDVIFIDNFLLCFVDSILWDEVFLDQSLKAWFENAPSQYRSACSIPCHRNCSATNSTELVGHCWGPESDQCQQIFSETCHSRCDGSCYGPDASQCCDSQCVGGCTGPTNKHCWSCRKFKDNDTSECLNECPPVTKYNSAKFRTEDNPDGKFAFGSVCIKNCSTVNTVADSGGCVVNCRQGYQAHKGRCVPCRGVWDKTCNGTEPGSWVKSSNINSFVGCTVIQGNVDILIPTFTGDMHTNEKGLTVENLTAFESVREIKGYLRIEASADGQKSLSCFGNLSTIGGNNLFRGKFSIFILNTRLEYLGLVSLTQVTKGHIVVARTNKNLCFAKTINWTEIQTDARAKIILPTENSTRCSRCSEQCADSNGCWGPDVIHCRRCKHYRFQQMCVSQCNAAHLADVLQSSDSYRNLTLFVTADSTNRNNFDENVCQKCHEECYETCTGPGADQCKSCLHYKDGPFCVPQCPMSKYAETNGTCRLCSDRCRDNSGCSGPDPIMGPGGCTLCKHFVFDWFNQSKIASTDRSSQWKPRQCMNETYECPPGFYFYSQTLPLKSIDKQSNASRHRVEMCKQCYEECLQCEDGSARCSACRHFRQDEQCVSKCSANHYLDASDNQTCLPCHVECSSCFGPTAYDCHHCRNYRVDVNSSVSPNQISVDIPKDVKISTYRPPPPKSMCAAECPAEALFSHIDSSHMERFCRSSPIISESLDGSQQLQADLDRKNCCVSSCISKWTFFLVLPINIIKMNIIWTLNI